MDRGITPEMISQCTLINYLNVWTFGLPKSFSILSSKTVVTSNKVIIYFMKDCMLKRIAYVDGLVPIICAFLSNDS
jgi:hypothetical protein